MHAARRSQAGELPPCLAFADSLGSAVVCHINHSGNTSSTSNTHRALKGTALDADAGAQAFDAAFDGLFEGETSCRRLLDPAMRRVEESGAREQSKRRSLWGWGFSGGGDDDDDAYPDGLAASLGFISTHSDAQSKGAPRKEEGVADGVSPQVMPGGLVSHSFGTVK